MAKIELHPRAKTVPFWLIMLAAALGMYALVQIIDAGKVVRDPRHPAPVATSAHVTPSAPGTVSPFGRTPACRSPLDSQCWESEQDGGPATLWRENARAMMLQQSTIDVLSGWQPGRDWSKCWLFLATDVIGCPDGYSVDYPKGV